MARWVCASINPGSSVASPMSITSAPGVSLLRRPRLQFCRRHHDEARPRESIALAIKHSLSLEQVRFARRLLRLSGKRATAPESFVPWGLPTTETPGLAKEEQSFHGMCFLR
jgi:hypothetical protein